MSNNAVAEGLSACPQYLPDAWILQLLRARNAARELWERAAERRAAGETVLPPQAQIFRALELTPPDAVRCVIVGQDPYHTPGVANGLAFSANVGCKIPPSLRNIFKELASDIGCPMPTSPDLAPWASQGVLLLNTALTVRAGAAGSHSNWGWQSVTGEILRVCYEELPQPIMFLLWGRHAQAAAQKAGISLTGWSRREFEENFSMKIPSRQDIIATFNPELGDKSVFCSSHPSPLGASKGSAEIPAFFGSRPFSKTNAFLKSVGVPEIRWELP